MVSKGFLFVFIILFGTACSSLGQYGEVKKKDIKKFNKFTHYSALDTTGHHLKNVVLNYAAIPTAIFIGIPLLLTRGPSATREFGEKYDGLREESEVLKSDPFWKDDSVYELEFVNTGQGCFPGNSAKDDIGVTTVHKKDFNLATLVFAGEKATLFFNQTRKSNRSPNSIEEIKYGNNGTHLANNSININYNSVQLSDFQIEYIECDNDKYVSFRRAR